MLNLYKNIEVVDNGDYLEVYFGYENGRLHLTFHKYEDWDTCCVYFGFEDALGELITDYGVDGENIICSGGRDFKDGKVINVYNELPKWFESLTEDKQKVLLQIVGEGFLVPDTPKKYGELMRFLEKKTLDQRIREKWFKTKG